MSVDVSYDIGCCIYIGIICRASEGVRLRVMHGVGNVVDVGVDTNGHSADVTGIDVGVGGCIVVCGADIGVLDVVGVGCDYDVVCVSVGGADHVIGVGDMSIVFADVECVGVVVGVGVYTVQQ